MAALLGVREAGSARPGSRRARELGALAWAVVCVSVSACSRDEPLPPTGQVLYLRHCASYHGTSGRGDGPAAESLRARPTDLTTLARRSGGRFDEAYVMRVIDGRRAVAAHGAREMPVWGAVFAEELEGARHTAYVVLLRSRSLTDYVRSLQEP